MTYSDAIIKRLTDLCVERGITTNKLATLSGITQSTLNSMMRGETKNPKLKTLRKIAMGFNMTVSEFMYLTVKHRSGLMLLHILCCNH